MSQTPPPPSSALSRAINRVVTRACGLPRLGRILIASLFALAVTLAVRPVIDLIYLDNFYTPDTVGVPAWIATAVGFGMYAVGWRVYVGLTGETPQPGRAPALFLAVGAAALIVVIVLSVHGLFTAFVEV